MKYLYIICTFCFLNTTAIGQEIWEVDYLHSNLRFEVGWQDFSMRTGEFKKFEGTITTASLEDLSDALIEFKVDAASVDVIADRLAEHVMSKKFLNVEVYPEIKFTSNGLTPTSDSTYISNGTLEICGVENTQEVSVWVKGYKETRKGNIFGIQVTMTVDRTAFGLDWGKPRLADKIKLVGHLLYKKQEEEEGESSK